MLHAVRRFKLTIVTNVSFSKRLAIANVSFKTKVLNNEPTDMIMLLG